MMMAKTVVIQFPLLFILLLIQNVLALHSGVHGVCGNLEAKIDQNTKILHEILRKMKTESRTILREVAYGKPSEQSSVHSGLSASKAVDGSVNTYMHTNIEQSPYWMVDLGKNYQIKWIEIFNRNEGSKSTGERLRNLDIIVGRSHNEMHLCAHYVGPALLGAHLRFECGHDENARYVKLMLKRRDYLHVAEVKVYAVDDRSS
ncbi:fucolectin-6-like [Mytilus californianus]|uniref:fucolectin-6-like n=1 Tax=Mytilus californianus TaxID=6549 RepID=UPI002247078B|nr:fucolectin-6-like [Mytilus californianus]